MARNMSSRGWLGIGVSVVVLGGIAAVAIWMSLSGSTNPDYQNRNEGPGVGEYFVNLWTDPNPPTTGEVEIRTRLTTSIGSPIDVNRLDIAVEPPDSEEPVELDTEQQIDEQSDGQIFIANATFEQPGSWRILITYSFGGGGDITDEFNVQVSE